MSRRQTFSVNPAANAKREDTRQLKDAAWKKEKAHYVIDFVKRHGWPADHEIDARSLCHCPSYSEVLLLLQFLIKLLCPRLSLESLDGEKLASILKKGLKYPYGIPVAKKVLQITPLTWHTMFGAIVWLVDKIEADEQQFEARRARAGTEGTHEFRAWVGSMYKKASTGSDDWRRAELDFHQNMEQQVRDLNKVTSERQQEVNQWRERLQEIRAQLDQVTTVEQQRDSCSKDLKSFTAYLTKMDEHIAAKVSAIAEDEHTSGDLDKEYATLEQQKCYVVQLLTTQVISKDEAEKLTKEKMRLNAQLADQTSRCKATLHQEQEIEHQLLCIVDLLDAKTAEVNKAAAIHHCRPGDKHAYSVGSVLSINKDKISLSNMGCINMQEFQLLNTHPSVIREVLTQLLQRYRQKHQKVVERLSVVNHEVKKQKADRHQDSKLIRTLADEVAFLEHSFALAANHVQSINKLKADLTQRQMKYAQERAKISAMVRAGLSTLLEHKSLMDSTLNKVFTQCEHRLNS